MQLTCCGLNKAPVYKKSRKGNTLIDFAMMEVLKKYKHELMDFFPFGSDERQFNSPGVEIPFGAFMRVNYHGYKEYHTSLDNKNIMNFNNFINNIKILKEAIIKIDSAKFYKRNVPLCEPFLSKRNLYSSLSKYTHFSKIDKLVEAIFWIMAYSDGKTSDIEIANISGVNKKTLKIAFKLLEERKLIKLSV